MAVAVPVSEPQMAPECVLFDLDGVIRHFDGRELTKIEQSHGLEPGTILRAAFEPRLLQPTITGEITRSEWTTRVGLAIGNPDAATAWQAEPGFVNDAVISIVRQLRERSTTVAILTNGTSATKDELASLEILDEFDMVFNSAAIGLAKPDPLIFQHACDELGLPTREVFFVDDSPKNVAAAIEVGLSGCLFVCATDLRAHLSSVGALPTMRVLT